MQEVCKNVKVPLSAELVSSVFPKRNSYLALATLCACAEELLTGSNASPCKNKPELNMHSFDITEAVFAKCAYGSCMTEDRKSTKFSKSVLQD